MNKPHEILGVREKATRDEILSAYNMLEKKYRAGKKDVSMPSPISDERFEQIDRAYCKLMGFEYQPKKLEPEDKKKVWQQMSRKEKFDHLYYYYRVHAVISVILLVLMVVTLRDCINRKPIELNVAIVGASQVADTEKVAADIKTALGITNDVSVQSLYFSEDMRSEYDMANQQKLMVMLAAGDLDVMLVDKDRFEQFAKMGVFMEIDTIVEELKLGDEYVEGGKLIADEQSAEHYYGIKLIENEYLKSQGYLYGENYLAIMTRVQNLENARLFVNFLLQKK